MFGFKAWMEERRFRRDLRWRARLLDGYTAEKPIQATYVSTAEMRWDLPGRTCLFFDREQVQLYAIYYPLGSIDGGGERLPLSRVSLLLSDPRIDTAEAFAEYKANVDDARKRQAAAKAQAEAAGPAAIPHPI